MTKKLTKNELLPLLVFVSIIAGIMTLGLWIISSKGQHNFKFSGVVEEEHVLYGNALVGYAVEEKGLTSKIESKLHDLMRPGAMHLYLLQIQVVEYDTQRWWKTTHHVESAQIPIFLQTEGDIADSNMTFVTKSLGRPSATFALRGIRYKGRVLKVIFKNADAYIFKP